MKLKNLFKGFMSTLLGLALIFNLGINSALAEIITLGEGGQFTIPAVNEAGVLVTPGLSAQDYPEYLFSVEGSWSNSAQGGDYDCLGSESYPTSNMTYTDEPAFSLVAESVKDVAQDGRHYEVCVTPDIAFIGDDEIKFVMNDAPGTYENNRGSLLVNYIRL